MIMTASLLLACCIMAYSGGLLSSIFESTVHYWRNNCLILATGLAAPVGPKGTAPRRETAQALRRLHVSPTKEMDQSPEGETVHVLICSELNQLAGLSVLIISVCDCLSSFSFF
jgi:hypothetical protein